MKHGTLTNCASCALGKSKSLRFPHQGNCVSTCFEVIHNDIWGVSYVLSNAHYMYIVIFINDYSRFIRVYFLHSKADVVSTFQASFFPYVKTQFYAYIKILHGRTYLGFLFFSTIGHPLPVFMSPYP